MTAILLVVMPTGRHACHQANHHGSQQTFKPESMSASWFTSRSASKLASKHDSKPA
jgi:hypothetical protein